MVSHAAPAEPCLDDDDALDGLAARLSREIHRELARYDRLLRFRYRAGRRGGYIGLDHWTPRGGTG